MTSLCRGFRTSTLRRSPLDTNLTKNSMLRMYAFSVFPVSSLVLKLRKTKRVSDVNPSLPSQTGQVCSLRIETVNDFMDLSDMDQGLSLAVSSVLNVKKVLKEAQYHILPHIAIFGKVHSSPVVLIGVGVCAFVVLLIRLCEARDVIHITST